MTLKLVVFIGEQPVYNLLSIRHLKPDEILFVGSRKIQDRNRNLKDLIGRDCPTETMEIHDPYRPAAIVQDVKKKIIKLGWAADEIMYDLSGGNRIMSFGAFFLASETESRLADLEYIRNNIHLRIYGFEDGQAVLQDDITLPGIITISDYLHAHIPGFTEEKFSKDEHGRTTSGGRFEEVIYKTLAPHVDEIMAGVRPDGVGRQIEIDLVVRCGNNVGIIEAKTGASKAGIDQLDTAGNPTYLGEHVVKFLITGRYLSRAYKSLAFAERVRVIELPKYDDGRSLQEQERSLLINTVLSELGGRRR